VFLGVLVLAYRGTLGQVLLGVFPSVELGFAVVCALLLWLAAPSGSALEAHRTGAIRCCAGCSSRRPTWA
jgi:hypothetical protein